MCLIGQYDTYMYLMPYGATYSSLFGISYSNTILGIGINGGFVFSSTNENIKVAVESESQFREVLNLIPVNNDGFFTDFTAMNNLDDALLFVYNSLLKSVVDNYASHRSSSIGGGYNVVLAEVQELYQQYGGGIPKHINGIRRFAHHMYDASENKPVGLFFFAIIVSFG